VRRSRISSTATSGMSAAAAARRPSVPGRSSRPGDDVGAVEDGDDGAERDPEDLCLCPSVGEVAVEGTEVAAGGPARSDHLHSTAMRRRGSGRKYRSTTRPKKSDVETARVEVPDPEPPATRSPSTRLR
jgi:hypothetical protein